MPDSVSSQTTQPRVGRRRRWWLLVALLIGLVVLLWIGMLVRDGLAVRADVLALRDYVTALPRPLQPADIDMTRMAQRATALDENLSALRSHAQPLLLLTPALGWLPEIGGDVQAAPALLDMALELTNLGRRAATTLAPLWPPETVNGRMSLPVITRLLQALPPASIDSWREPLDLAQAARQRLDTARLSPRPARHAQSLRRSLSAGSNRP